MKIEIEQYKGQTIEYDDEHDKFVCDMTIEDNFKTTKRLSLKDVRKEIDNFVKTNLNFKSFKVLQVSGYGFDINVLSVEGIRNDNSFTCKNEREIERGKGYTIINFDKENRRDYNKYYEYDADVIKERKAIQDEEKKYQKIISEKEKKLLSKLKPFDPNSISHYTKAFAKS